jgi:TetR/AcrR family transcriptional repressor of nem operon
VARRKEFDVEAALDQAMRTFWRHGYRGTSVRDLCDAMGIGAGSFYATFDSKAALFRLALRRYLRAHAPGEPSPDAIRRWFDRVIADREPRGCLLVDSAVEHADLPDDARALVTDGLAALEDFFWLCLRDRPTARRDARTLAATLTGIHVLHRTGAPEAALREIADRALEALDKPQAVR